MRYMLLFRNHVVFKDLNQQEFDLIKHKYKEAYGKSRKFAQLVKYEDLDYDEAMK